MLQVVAAPTRRQHQGEALVRLAASCAEWLEVIDARARPLARFPIDGLTLAAEPAAIRKRAVSIALEAAGLGPDDVALIVPHQANVRIIDAACQRLGVPMERTAMVLHRTGNTSSASIPLALADALDAGRVHEGDNILMVGFGAGMTAASAIIRWGGTAAKGVAP